METPKFLKNIDWKLLREQKECLVDLISLKYNNESILNTSVNDYLQGIVSLIDNIQDFAIDEANISENIVFDFQEDSEEIVQCPNLKEDIDFYYQCLCTDNTEEKTFLICSRCGSNNILFKAYKDNPIDNHYFCNDCQAMNSFFNVKLKANSKVIGFQIVGKENTKFNGNIHPYMAGSSNIYSLSQCKEMFRSINSKKWKLLAIWNGDIEEPVMWFEGDCR